MCCKGGRDDETLPNPGLADTCKAHASRWYFAHLQGVSDPYLNLYAFIVIHDSMGYS
ncbi:hypothetical protein PISMIDRAFT_684741, partial [Pisolithus microcarpus 441]